MGRPVDGVVDNKKKLHLSKFLNVCMNGGYVGVSFKGQSLNDLDNFLSKKDTGVKLSGAMSLVLPSDVHLHFWCDLLAAYWIFVHQHHWTIKHPHSSHLWDIAQRHHTLQRIQFFGWWFVSEHLPLQQNEGCTWMDHQTEKHIET